MYQPGGLEDVQGSVWAKMRDYVHEQAISRGITVIDMHEVFIERFALEGKRFEFPTDSHWNGEGHRAVADAISQTEMYKELFEK
jgi:hypothetical protein